MRRLKEINWSDVIRRAIQDTIEVEGRHKRSNWSRIVQASRDVDEIRRYAESQYGYVKYNSAETIRFWRDRRYAGT